MTLEDVRAVIRGALDPSNFLILAGAPLRIEHQPLERIPWELFRGHLLQERQTRQTNEFESWYAWFDGALSVKLDWPGQSVYVTRGIRVYAWEPYEDERGAICSRETQEWHWELIATLDFERIGTTDPLGRHLAHALFTAVAGRQLPITSLESPLPAFSLGQLAYLSRPGISMLERAKLLELNLRAKEPAEMGDWLVQELRESGLALSAIPELSRTIFHHVALSPYTAFADNFAAFLDHLAAPRLLGPPAIIDLLSYLLRHLVRHLTAYDLVTFHNRGANYPDALFLDTLLKTYLRIMERYPNEFDITEARLRRRALRQAWLIRKHYEGHPVPDIPTSPGENLRVMPEPFSRVSEEQLSQPAKRRRRLFSNDPLETHMSARSRSILQQAFHDLVRPEELRELGMATYLDRPLGIFKQPGEVDRTPLLSYEAFSREIAVRRLNQLRERGVFPGGAVETILVRGLAVAELRGQERPGVVALEDARRAAADFRFLRTTRSSLDNVLSQYSLDGLRAAAPELVEWLTRDKDVLFIRSLGSVPNQDAVWTVFDEQMQPRLELGLGQPSGGPVRYVEWFGTEHLEDGLRVLRLRRKEPHGQFACQDVQNIVAAPFTGAISPQA